MPEMAFKSSVKDTFPDELADIIIRVGDLAEYLGYDLERHVELKMEYNSHRPKRHGKNF
jgi:NTP pyrophosphatase (non-canonical NTP hydrolase)